MAGGHDRCEARYGHGLEDKINYRGAEFLTIRTTPRHAL